MYTCCAQTIIEVATTTNPGLRVYDKWKLAEAKFKDIRDLADAMEQADKLLDDADHAENAEKITGIFVILPHTLIHFFSFFFFLLLFMAKNNHLHVNFY